MDYKIANISDDFISLKDISEITGYDPKHILKWVSEGILLPKAKDTISMGGREGLKSSYPKENLKRLQILRWYENFFGKMAGKVGGKDLILHLLFIFGFRSPEIYEVEKKIISSKAQFILKQDGDILATESYSLFKETTAMISKESFLFNVLSQGLKALKLINPLQDDLKNIKMDRKMLNTWENLIRKRIVINMEELFIPKINERGEYYSIFNDYLVNCQNINKHFLDQLQDKFYFWIASIAGYPNERDIIKYNLDVSYLYKLEKALNFLRFPIEKMKYDILNSVLNIENAITLPIILFLTLDTEESTQAIAETWATDKDFSDEDLQQIELVEERNKLTTDRAVKSSILHLPTHFKKDIL